MKHTTLMQIAFLVSSESKCISWNTGCVIEKDGDIISTGCNGTPSGHKNCCEHAQDMGWTKQKMGIPLRELNEDFRADHSKWSEANEVHAEQNAIMNAAKKGVSIKGATMLCTMSPCPQCAKNIAQSGIRNFIYCHDYDRSNTEWQKLLKDSGIEIMQISLSKLDKLYFPNIPLRGQLFK